MKFSRFIVKYRIAILILALVLLVPSLIGFINTRINYDMLTYLPQDMDTVKGQDILLNEFGKGAFSLIILEDMPDKDVSSLRQQILDVDHVDTVLWYDSIADIAIPKELLPQKIYDVFNTDNATLMAVFFDSSTSAEETINAVDAIKNITDKKLFISGMSVMVSDLKNLCEEEEPIYVTIAVVLSCIAMMIFMDNWIAPFLFLIGIGFAVVYNMGTNFAFGEISYLTKALSSVLLLAVTMDYSIFLWHSYKEEKAKTTDKKEAMATAIKNTIISISGSSITTIAGFIALCFMSFTLGKDLGIVMAKGVIFGLISCITILPSLILVFDPILEKTNHRSIVPDTGRAAGALTKIYPVFLILFVVLLIPSLYGYRKTNNEVYYELGDSLPEDMEYVISTAKLTDDFKMGATHMILTDSSLPDSQEREMLERIGKVKGIKATLGLDSLIGPLVPVEMVPQSVKDIFENDKYQLTIIASEYKTASDEVNAQIDEINGIIKDYDKNAMIIGEAPCTKDLIETTDKDFKTVNIFSIAAIFLIIFFVERSITLPVILVMVIELSIFINLGLAHFTGTSLPFIAPICISTIQLGATVDYAILMTTRYKKEREKHNKRDAVNIALSTSIPSVIASALGLFAATFGVSIYSDVDMISSLCTLMARGALISMFCVILILPAMFMLFDKVICKTTLKMNAK